MDALTTTHAGDDGATCTSLAADSPFRRMLEGYLALRSGESRSGPPATDKEISDRLALLSLNERRKLQKSLYRELLRQLQQEAARSMVLGRTPDQPIMPTRRISTLGQEHAKAHALIITIEPIYRLPVEILREIFLLAIHGGEQTPGNLASVCKLWRAVGVGIGRLWSTIKISTWTDAESVGMALRRAGRAPLEVELDTERDVDSSASILFHPYLALIASMGSVHRWKSLTISSVPEDQWLRQAGVALETWEVREDLILESLKVFPKCQESTFVARILDFARAGMATSLQSLDIPSPYTTAQFFSRDYAHIIRSLQSLTVDGRYLRQDVDILPHFRQLEVFDAQNLPLAFYPSDVRLSLESTLRKIRFQSTSIQWMAGKVFSQLEECTISNPRNPEPVGLFGVELPICSTFAYEGHPIEMIGAFAFPDAETVSIRTRYWTKRKGDAGLLSLQGLNVAEKIFGPILRSLDLGLHCSDDSMIQLLRSVPGLESLTLHLPRPSALGERFFNELLAKPQHVLDRDLETLEWFRWAKEQNDWHMALCPSLKVMNLKYQRWHRYSEVDNITLLIIAAAWSRKLVSFTLSFTAEEGGALELIGSPPSILSDLRLLALLPSDEDEYRVKAMFEVCIHQLYTNRISLAPRNLISFLNPACYHSFFHHLRIFSCDKPIIKSTMDILPYFKQLEELWLRKFPLPSYASTTPLPLVRTLRRLSLENTPIGWLEGRTFRKLVKFKMVLNAKATIPRFEAIIMPICTKFECKMKTVEPLASFHLPALRKLHISNVSTGNLDFISSWKQSLLSLNLAEFQLRVLHLDAAGVSAHISTILGRNVDLEVLVLRFPWYEEADISSLNSLLTFQRSPSVEDTEAFDQPGTVISYTATGGEEKCGVLWPNLRVLSLKFMTLEHEAEQIRLRTMCDDFIRMRQRLGVPLKSCLVWWNYEQDQIPLELVGIWEKEVQYD